MKICLLGDTHFCYRNSFNEYYEKFYSQVFFPYLYKNDIKTVFQFGDLFDNRKSIDIVGLHHANEMFFNKFTDEFPLYSLIGNHDIAKKNTLKYNSPGLAIDSSSNFTPVSYPLEWNNILIIPWICEENYDEIMTAIDNTKCKYLFGHLELANFPMQAGHVIDHGMNHEIFKKFDKVFSGHYHSRSDYYNDSNIIYLGTPYEMTFADCDDPKYFYIFDTDTGEYEAIVNPYKMFHKIVYNDGSDYDLSTVENCMVKLIVDVKTDQMKYDIFVKQLNESNPMELKIIENFEQFGDEKIDVDNIDISDTLSLLHKYIEETQFDINKDLLKSTVQSLYIDALNMENLE